MNSERGPSYLALKVHYAVQKIGFFKKLIWTRVINFIYLFGRIHISLKEKKNTKSDFLKRLLDENIQNSVYNIKKKI